MCLYLYLDVHVYAFAYVYASVYMYMFIKICDGKLKLGLFRELTYGMKLSFHSNAQFEILIQLYKLPIINIVLLQFSNFTLSKIILLRLTFPPTSEAALNKKLSKSFILIFFKVKFPPSKLKPPPINLVPVEVGVLHAFDKLKLFAPSITKLDDAGNVITLPTAMV